LRTIAIYKNDKRVIGALIVLIVGQCVLCELLSVPRLTGLPCSWAVIFAGISLTATYIDGTGCAIIHTKANMISAVFIYSMGFGEAFGSHVRPDCSPQCIDFIILCLSTYKLAFPLTGRSELVRLLFKDGYVFHPRVLESTS
jgi:hypothetical protein